MIYTVATNIVTLFGGTSMLNIDTMALAMALSCVVFAIEVLL